MKNVELPIPPLQTLLAMHVILDPDHQIEANSLNLLVLC